MTILTDKIKRLKKDVDNAKTESALNDVERRANNLSSEIRDSPYANKKIKTKVNKYILKIKSRINRKRRNL